MQRQKDRDNDIIDIKNQTWVSVVSVRQSLVFANAWFATFKCIEIELYKLDPGPKANEYYRLKL